MEPRLTDHRVTGISIVSAKSKGWRVIISSDCGETSVDFGEKELATGFAERYMKLLGITLSPDEYLALRCGPSAAAKVVEISGTARCQNLVVEA